MLFRSRAFSKLPQILKVPVESSHRSEAVALVLAAINQIFSLLDPLIFRHIIDSYATRYREYSSPQFIRGVGLLLAAAVGVALVSRIAKNFQDYFVNVITQKVGARIYTDGVRHSLDLPYTLFEDQRSGETLGKLQRVRSDVEKFIALLVNMVFTTLIGLALPPRLLCETAMRI